MLMTTSFEGRDGSGSSGVGCESAVEYNANSTKQDFTLMKAQGLKVDPFVVLVLSLVFIFSVVALHSMSATSLTWIIC
jgi:hypothetical protein